MFFGYFNLFYWRVRNNIIINIFYNYSPKSFDDLNIWLKDLKENANPDIKVFLIGNKTDLDDSRLINKEEGKQLQEDYNLDLFKETSFINQNSAQEIFIESAKLLYFDYANNISGQNKQKDCIIY